MLQKGWLLLLTTFMLVIVIHARQISFKEENRVKHAVYLSPKFLLGAGSVIGKFYQNLDFPRGHVALKEFNAEIVDEDGNYVSLHETITFRSCEINIEQCSISNSAPTHAAVPSINNATVVTLLLLSDTIQVWAVDIAVKVLKRSDERVEEQFMAEVGTIGRTYHINLSLMDFMKLRLEPQRDFPTCTRNAYRC